MPRRRERASGRRALLALLVGTALAAGGLEVAARLLSGEAPNGMPEMRVAGLECALLPYRPTAEETGGWLTRSAEARFQILDDELGWTLRPSAESRVQRGRGGRRIVYRTNPQGLRADPDRTFAPEPAPGALRVLVLGDSFTFGSDVTQEESWAARLEGLSERLEVLNLGVPGYGMDQAFLRWRALGSRFRAHAVLLVVWPEDCLRNLNVLRYYLEPRAGYLLRKPRFVLAEDELRLVHSPVPPPAETASLIADPLGPSGPTLEDEGWFSPRDLERPWWFASRLARATASLARMAERVSRRRRLYSGEDPAALELAQAIAARFAAEVRAHGATPIVVVLPQEDLLANYPTSFPLAARLREREIPVIDLFPTFLALDEPYFFDGGHFNPWGCERVAEALLEGLAELLPELR